MGMGVLYIVHLYTTLHEKVLVHQEFLIHFLLQKLFMSATLLCLNNLWQLPTTEKHTMDDFDTLQEVILEEELKDELLENSLSNSEQGTEEKEPKYQDYVLTPVSWNITLGQNFKMLSCFYY